MRLVRFNAVGVLGFVVQLGLLALLVHVARLHYLLATLVAVETALLHNFAWHERWTWKDRPSSGRARALRLARFHALNGGVSIVGNLLLMAGLVGTLHVAPVAANTIAVAVCAALNFIAADRIVFEQ